MMEYNKKSILEATLKNVEDSLNNLKKSSKSTKERAIAAPGIMTSYSDTSKSQLQNLAYGIDQRIHTLSIELEKLRNYRIINNIEKVSLGALVEIEDIHTEEGKILYVLLAGAGNIIKTTKGLVNIITTEAPLFHAMRYLEPDEEFTFENNSNKKEYFISSVE